ncbi:GAT-like domain-containing protein [Saccharata proteae CBS 121410]|uniref:GAT-like domain-containing protein n=1 Tax=Saccharata proteae CBS 121410 TaxID=1314787 RepID=A0A9P4LVL5_9PEZI|nr:GAT-like domain-containing protein [Saccharata proteae CBS 121410]
MVLKRLNGLLGKRPAAEDDGAAEGQDTPEANAARGVRLFCESGGPNSSTEEIQYLPDIVTAAESSPAAAAACAVQIRKFLSKDNSARPHVQYNSIMLIRILTDNPGPSFTKNVDAKFVSTVKELLRQGRDRSVQHILRETLYELDKNKAYDTNLGALFAMWRKEQQTTASAPNPRPAAPLAPRTMNAPPWDQNNGTLQTGAPTSQSRSQSRSRGLPEPHELASRIEEARTSAKLLLQLIQSTPAAELPSNELIKEFAERCQQAQRSMQNYINAENPSPDDDTMLTLIETNEQLSLALSKHQRAMLAARRTISSNSVPNASGTGSGTQSPAPMMTSNGAPQLPATTATNGTSESPAQNYAPPPVPPPDMQATLLSRRDTDTDTDTMKIAALTSTTTAEVEPEADDPFADSHAGTYTYPHEPAAPTNAPPAPPPRQVGGSGTGSPESYHAHHASTPSYLQRQESAGVNRTMHGASPPVEDEGGLDVSPVDERKPITYRY